LGFFFVAPPSNAIIFPVAKTAVFLIWPSLKELLAIIGADAKA
jgi:hypothetical protein